MDLGNCNDPISYNEAISSDQSSEWNKAMTDELNSMYQNDVWDLVELPKGVMLRKRALTIKKPSTLFQGRIPYGLSWLL
ncbi:hypothetical protein QVD17_28832 [Tagetes erecta]|uniref:Uncharacterized protein n=1 Tax=Tagetes erecta TaxID=13708 RepID=A0AAD8NSI7_TARER|nr:hypothetical protein QVD17_28832 [Tagetes erecta]